MVPLHTAKHWGLRTQELPDDSIPNSRTHHCPLCCLWEVQVQLNSA